MGCPCHDDLRRQHAPLQLQTYSSMPDSVGADVLWVTRALQPTKAYLVPPPHDEPTFAWVLEPFGGVVASEWTVYTDGSLLDGPTPLLRRTGWAFVAIDREGVIRASAHGVPPGWICTIFGAETWAVLQAVTHSQGDAILRIDCKAAVDVLLAGREKAISPRRITARAWIDIFSATDGTPPSDVSWIPAHTVLADVGRKRIGNGGLLTAMDRRGNDEADRLAKLAVRLHRVPGHIQRAVREQEQQVAKLAWWIAQVTLAANSWGPHCATPIRRQSVGAQHSLCTPGGSHCGRRFRWRLVGTMLCTSAFLPDHGAAAHAAARLPHVHH
jgi:ribonuclease HI